MNVEGGGWTVHVIWVDKREGAMNGMDEEKRYTVSLPRGGETTTSDFIQAVNAAKPEGDVLNLMDLSPFDESKLGYKTSNNRRNPDPNFASRWVPKHENPKPVNCKWTPDRANREQKISDAGLCDGAELSFVKVSRWKG